MSPTVMVIPVTLGKDRTGTSFLQPRGKQDSHMLRSSHVEGSDTNNRRPAVTSLPRLIRNVEKIQLSGDQRRRQGVPQLPLLNLIT